MHYFVGSAAIMTSFIVDWVLLLAARSQESSARLNFGSSFDLASLLFNRETSKLSFLNPNIEPYILFTKQPIPTW